MLPGPTLPLAWGQHNLVFEGHLAPSGTARGTGKAMLTLGLQ